MATALPTADLDCVPDTGENIPIMVMATASICSILMLLMLMQSTSDNEGVWLYGVRNMSVIMPV